MPEEMPQDQLRLLVRFYMRYYGCKSMKEAKAQIKLDLKEIK